MPFQIIRADITKVKADAIVNTANPSVAIGDGVDSAIYNAAGKELLFEERKKIGNLEPGDVAITPAFNLDAKYIIHASGPWWDGGKHDEVQLLRQCYDKSLQMAYDTGCKSIAFPLLATGTYGFPKELGLDIAVSSFTRFLEDHEMEIILVVFGKKATDISGKLFDDVKSFIDDDYVTETLGEEYKHDRIIGAASNAVKPGRIPGGLFSSFHAERLNKIELRPTEDVADNEYYEDEYDEDVTGFEPDDVIGGLPKEDMQPKACASMAMPKEASLEDELKDIYTDSFAKHLQQMINKKGLKNSEVYAAANISKQYFSKLIKGQVNPSKEKVLALAVGLRLNLDEAVDFLRLAGYALSPISQTDKVVEYFIRKEEYSVLKIDIVLFDYGLEPLSK